MFIACTGSRADGGDLNPFIQELVVQDSFRLLTPVRAGFADELIESENQSVKPAPTPDS